MLFIAFNDFLWATGKSCVSSRFHLIELEFVLLIEMTAYEQDVPIVMTFDSKQFGKYFLSFVLMMCYVMTVFIWLVVRSQLSMGIEEGFNSFGIIRLRNLNCNYLE